MFDIESLGEINMTKADYEALEAESCREFWDLVVLDEIRKRMPVLFSRENCNSCNRVLKVLREKRMNFYEVCYEDNPKTFREYGINQTPTLLSTNKEYSGVNDILRVLQAC